MVQYVLPNGNKPAVKPARLGNAKLALTRLGAKGVADNVLLPFRRDPSKEITTSWHQ